jgi:hypothetical protein
MVRGGVALFFGSLLLWSASSGNIQPLIVAALVYGVDRPSGALWIGLTASLKVFPLFYALVYVGRGMWLRAAAATALAAVLWLPVLLFDLSDYPRGISDSPSPLLAASPLVFGLATVAAVAATLLAARRKSAWLVAAIGLFAVLPRVSLIDLTQILVGTAPIRSEPSTDE